MLSDQGLLHRVLLTVGLVVLALAVAAAIRTASRAILGKNSHDRSRFWIAQATHLLVLASIIAIIVVLWFAGGKTLATSGAWIAAGLTVALQRVVTAFSGYLIILRGNIFTVGDRIMLGGVRGDVVALGFMQTTVMEMGQSPGEKGDDPSMWIHGRQYSGRIVRVTNDKIFDEPVYNFTRDFPFMWEEIQIPVKYGDDYERVERILLDVATRHTQPIVDEARPDIEGLRRKYFLSEAPKLEPRVFLRLTDNWIELSMRFLGRDRDIRSLKDAMFREILTKLDEAKIGIASGTYAIVEMPTLQVHQVAGTPPA